MNYLFDTSSILNIIKSRKDAAIKVLKENYTLQLALYEIRNAIWKDITLLKSYSLDTGLKIISTVKKLLNYMNIINPNYPKNVLTIAANLPATFYDASYIAATLENNLTFVTDDKKLTEKIKQNILYQRIFQNNTRNIITNYIIDHT